MSERILRTFKALALASSLGVVLFSFTACGPNSGVNREATISEEFKQKLFREPDQKLTTTVPEKFQPSEVYDIVDVQVAADKTVTSISARVIVSSSAGRETIELVGMIRPDGSASLVDLAPLPDGKNRLVAEATCADKSTCKHIIVNVYYNVAGKTRKKQFASAALLAEDSPTPLASATPASSETAVEVKNEEVKPEQPGSGHEEEIHDTEKDLADETDASDATLGEFVGAPRNESLIGKLYPRSEVPELPPEEGEGTGEKPGDAKGTSADAGKTDTSIGDAEEGLPVPSEPDQTSGGASAGSASGAQASGQGAGKGSSAGAGKASGQGSGKGTGARKGSGAGSGTSQTARGTNRGGSARDATRGGTFGSNPRGSATSGQTSKPAPAKDDRGILQRAKDWVTSWFKTEEPKKPTPKPAPKQNPSPTSGRTTQPAQGKPTQGKPATSPAPSSTRGGRGTPAQPTPRSPGPVATGRGGRTSQPTPARPPVTPPKPAPAKPAPAPARPPAAPPKPAPVKPAPAPARPPAQPTKPTPQKPAPAPAQPAPARPAPPAPPKPAPPKPAPQQPAPSAPPAQPEPRAEEPARTSEPNPDRPVGTAELPFPPATPAPDDSDIEKRITLKEARTAPLINLQNGGIAQGSYSGAGQPRAKIINASLLPDSGRGLNAIRINAGAHFGTGMLVSFLQNAASYLFRELGLSLFVGDMSVRNGGRFGQSHQTHKNGLDADIAYLAIKNPLRDSALASNGRVVSGFNFEATWTFLQLAAKQEFISEAKKVSSISRVFMSHRVKDGFCAWAKEKDLLDDPFNRELMRLVRREKGHHKHFHLSMKCSPHYPTCRNLAGPPPEGPGCP